MNKKELLNSILSFLQEVKEDKSKLQQIYDFMTDEIYEEPEEDVIEIPEKYKKLVHDIAENIYCGYICYLNTDTMEHIDIPQGILEDLGGYDDDGLWQKELDKIDAWKNVLKFEPLFSSDSFRIMEQFANQLDDEKLQNKLITALERHRPFANFKNIVDNSDYRQDWFAFKQARLEEHVFEQFEVKNN